MHALLYATILAVVHLLPDAGRATPAMAALEIQPRPLATLQPGQSAIVSGTEGHGLRVRAGPATSQPIVRTLDEGASVQIAAGPVRAGGDDWYQIKVGTSTTGWSTGRYLVASNTARARSTVTGRRTFLARVTAYADGIGGVPHGARTYSGTRTRWGVVAVDPKVIPIGSVLLIEGHGDTAFVAEDTGSGIKGQAIDLWLPDPRAARTYGTQYRHVTIIREGPAR